MGWGTLKGKPSALEHLTRFPCLLWLSPGKGRRASSAFMWLRSPIRTLCLGLCKRYRCKILTFLLLLGIGFLLFKFIYSAPVSGQLGDGHS